MKKIKKDFQKKFNFLKEYKNCWDYIKNSRNFILIVFGILSLFSFLGYFIVLPSEINNYILQFLNNIVEQTKGFSQFGLTKFIFLNNLRSTFFGVFFGIFFGVFPLISSASNGFFLGFVCKMSVNTQGAISFLQLLPHGIFEFPAIFISLGMGLRLGGVLFDKKKNFREEIINSFKVFLMVIVPLLLIAGIIEAMLIFLLR